MKNYNLILLLIISFFLSSSIYAQAAPQALDEVKKPIPTVYKPRTLPIAPGKVPRNDPRLKKTTSLPDLSISKLSASPKSVNSGDQVKLHAAVKNSGKSTLQNVKVRFLNMNTRKKLGEVVITVGAGTTKQSAITVPVNGKNKITIKAIVNPDQSITESNKRNNEKTTVVTIKKKKMTKSARRIQQTSTTPKNKMTAFKRKPDLLPVKLKLDQETISVGSPMVARVTIKNFGTKNINNINVSFLINRKQVGTRKVSIPANSTSPVTFRYAPKKTGNYTFSVKVDPGNIVDERNERNNSANTKLQVNQKRLASSPVNTAMSNDIKPKRLESTPLADHRDIRYGQTVLGVRGSYKCGRSYTDIMYIECLAYCSQTYREAEPEICIDGCRIAHEILSNI